MRPLARIMFVVALLGFADATYLAVQHYTDGAIPCSLTHGCGIVTTSAYSEILGIPVALLGAIYYFMILAGLFVAIDKNNEKLFRVLAKMTVVGLGASLWFVSLQFFVLHAICQWCMASALTSTTLFVLGCIALRTRRTSDPSPSQSEPV